MIFFLLQILAKQFLFFFSDVRLFVCVSQDGDGKLGAEDMKVYWAKLKALLTANLPSSGGFSLGFLYGVKQG